MFPPQNHKKTCEFWGSNQLDWTHLLSLGSPALQRVSEPILHLEALNFDIFVTGQVQYVQKASALTMWLHEALGLLFPRKTSAPETSSSKDINSDFGPGFSSTSYWTTNGVQRVKATHSTLILLPPQLCEEKTSWRIRNEMKWYEMCQKISSPGPLFSPFLLGLADWSLWVPDTLDMGTTSDHAKTAQPRAMPITGIFHGIPRLVIHIFCHWHPELFCQMWADFEQVEWILKLSQLQQLLSCSNSCYLESAKAYMRPHDLAWQWT